MKNLFKKTIVTLLTAMILFGSFSTEAFARYYDPYTDLSYNDFDSYDRKLAVNTRISKYDGLFSYGKDTGTKKSKANIAISGVIKKTTTIYECKSKYKNGETINSKGKKLATLYKGTLANISYSKYYQYNKKYLYVSIYIEENTKQARKLGSNGGYVVNGYVKKSNVETNEKKMAQIQRKIVNNKNTIISLYDRNKIRYIYGDKNLSENNIVFSAYEIHYDDVYDNWTEKEYYFKTSKSKVLYVGDKYIKVRMAVIEKQNSNKIYKYVTGYIPRNYTLSAVVTKEPKLTKSQIKYLKKLQY